MDNKVAQFQNICICVVLTDQLVKDEVNNTKKQNNNVGFPGFSHEITLKKNLEEKNHIHNS